MEVGRTTVADRQPRSLSLGRRIPRAAIVSVGPDDAASASKIAGHQTRSTRTLPLAADDLGSLAALSPAAGDQLWKSS